MRHQAPGRLMMSIEAKQIGDWYEENINDLERRPKSWELSAFSDNGP